MNNLTLLKVKWYFICIIAPAVIGSFLYWVSESLYSSPAPLAVFSTGALIILITLLMILYANWSKLPFLHNLFFIYISAMSVLALGATALVYAEMVWGGIAVGAWYVLCTIPAKIFSQKHYLEHKA